MSQVFEKARKMPAGTRLSPVGPCSIVATDCDRLGLAITELVHLLHIDWSHRNTLSSIESNLRQGGWTMRIVHAPTWVSPNTYRSRLDGAATVNSACSGDGNGTLSIGFGRGRQLKFTIMVPHTGIRHRNSGIGKSKY